MRYLSVCSGIEAATVAWRPLGWKAAAFSEIEAFPRAVLQHHYPDVPLHGDFTTIKGDEYGSVDLLCGGTPCQSFSVAGLRGGLQDDRGNLTLEFVRLAQRLRPRWLVWENVPGVLSSNRGRDFGSFLAALGECGYGFAYRVLDAQYFGVPQRRRRVIVVGYFGDWKPAAEVLFERESLCGDITPSREKGEGVAKTVTAGAGRCRGEDKDNYASEQVASTGSVPHCLNAGGMGRQDYETETLIASAIPINTQVATRHNKLGERTAFGIGEDGDPSFTLQANHHHAVAFAQNTRDEVRLIGGDGQIAGALAAESGMKQQTYVCTLGHTKSNGLGVSEADVANTLESVSSANQAVACFKGGQGDKAGGIGYDENLSPTLSAADSGTNRTPALMQGLGVRRLTPEECESLQGFPRGYTLVPYRGKPAADGPRYKAIGNSWAVPKFAWLGKRIDQWEKTNAK